MLALQKCGCCCYPIVWQVPHVPDVSKTALGWTSKGHISFKEHLVFSCDRLSHRRENWNELVAREGLRHAVNTRYLSKQWWLFSCLLGPFIILWVVGLVKHVKYNTNGVLTWHCSVPGTLHAMKQLLSSGHIGPTRGGEGVEVLSFQRGMGFHLLDMEEKAVGWDTVEVKAKMRNQTKHSKFCQGEKGKRSGN